MLRNFDTKYAFPHTPLFHQVEVPLLFCSVLVLYTRSVVLSICRNYLFQLNLDPFEYVGETVGLLSLLAVTTGGDTFH